MYLLAYPLRGPEDAGGRASKESTHDGHWQQPALHSNNLAQSSLFFSTVDLKVLFGFPCLLFSKEPKLKQGAQCLRLCLFGFSTSLFILFLSYNTCMIKFFHSLDHQKAVTSWIVKNAL